MRCRAAALIVCLIAIPGALAACASTPPDQVRDNGRVLLTYEGSNGDQTAQGGILGENASHCITVEPVVVIAPAGSKLLDDGSVIVAGQTWKPGSFVRISGSYSPSVPSDSPCHAAKNRYWVSATTWTSK